MVIIFTSKTKLKLKNIDGETPFGAINGINKNFITQNKFLINDNIQIKVYLNGVRQFLLKDYNISESIINTGFDTISLHNST